MGIRRVLAGLLVGATALCALPAVANAAMRKATGKTSQRLPALVWVRDDGSVALVKVKYRARCRAPGFRSSGVMYYRDNERKPFVRNGAQFSDGGKFEDTIRGVRTVFNTSMSGVPSADGGFEGNFRVQTRYYRKGKRIDFCQTGVRTWKVGPPG
jgi:hypothetical protein